MEERQMDEIMKRGNTRKFKDGGDAPVSDREPLQAYCWKYA